MQAVILAGGKGTRLKPFTTNIPKPLVPVDDIPILEVVLRQLKHYGFTDVIITVNHLAELIMAVFGDGEKLGLHITYFVEDAPLGTAGSLGLLSDLDSDFVMESDGSRGGILALDLEGDGSDYQIMDVSVTNICTTQLIGDLNMDCAVDLIDLEDFAENWLDSSY